MSMVVYKDLELQIFTLDEKLDLLGTPYLMLIIHR